MFYATTVGGFGEQEIPTTSTSAARLQVPEIIDRAVEHGFLPAAAPAERACTWCDFRAVCGVRGRRQCVNRKAKDNLADLDALRSMR